MKITYQSIGLIHSPFKDVVGMPIQPAGALGVQGTVEIMDEFVAGLKDIEGFSHIILVYHFHQAKGWQSIVKPFMDSKPHGVFATRAPKRPNPIGLSVVRLRQVAGNTLHIENVDILDGTPLLDIKPYVPDFDEHRAERVGWLDRSKAKVKSRISDGRFR